MTQWHLLLLTKTPSLSLHCSLDQCWSPAGVVMVLPVSHVVCLPSLYCFQIKGITTVFLNLSRNCRILWVYSFFLLIIVVPSYFPTYTHTHSFSVHTAWTWVCVWECVCLCDSLRLKSDFFLPFKHKFLLVTPHSSIANCTFEPSSSQILLPKHFVYIPKCWPSINLSAISCCVRCCQSISQRNYCDKMSYPRHCHWNLQ